MVSPLSSAPGCSSLALDRGAGAPSSRRSHGTIAIVVDTPGKYRRTQGVTVLGLIGNLKQQPEHTGCDGDVQRRRADDQENDTEHQRADNDDFARLTPPPRPGAARRWR